MTKFLGFGQISFATPDRFFRNFTFRDVHYRAYNFVIACLVPKAICKIMKMLYANHPVSATDSIIKVTSALRARLKGLFDKAHIVRMISRQYQIGRRFRLGRVPIRKSEPLPRT